MMPSQWPHLLRCNVFLRLIGQSTGRDLHLQITDLAYNGCDHIWRAVSLFTERRCSLTGLVVTLGAMLEFAHFTGVR